MRVTGEQYKKAQGFPLEVDSLFHALTYVIDKGEPRCLEYPDNFDSAVYIASYNDLMAAGITDGLSHYLRYGWKEGRWRIPPDFDGAAYIAYWKDVREAGYTAADAGVHYNRFGYKEKRWPLPAGEIKAFNAIPALDDPDNCYFTACRVNGEMRFATYKDGSYTAHIKNIAGKVLDSFNCESCFMIIPFKGGYNMSQEHGRYSTVDKGMIYRLINGVWQEVYRHPRWTLITEMHVHTDGYLYATGGKWGDSSDPAGIVRSLDGVNWEVWYENLYEYRFWGMTSKDGNLWIASTSSGTDWGANDCRPSVFCNKALALTDYDHPNSGFWAIEAWNDDIYLGRCGDAAVVRFSDKKEVLTMPGYESIHDLAIDKKTNTLIAFCNKSAGSGAIVKATKDGNNWYTMDEGFTVPLIVDGYYDDQEDALYLCAGVFTGRGKIYKSER